MPTAGAGGFLWVHSHKAQNLCCRFYHIWKTEQWESTTIKDKETMRGICCLDQHLTSQPLDSVFSASIMGPHCLLRENVHGTIVHYLNVSRRRLLCERSSSCFIIYSCHVVKSFVWWLVLCCFYKQWLWVHVSQYTVPSLCLCPVLIKFWTRSVQFTHIA